MSGERRRMVEVYTDGACSGNPGPGGYGAILRYGGHEREISGCEPSTTNNRMEMTAALKALEALKEPCRVHLVTDSKYLVQGMTEWLPAWQRNGWRTSAKKEVLNRDLWERLAALALRHEIRWEWIQGHDGHAENERCDRIAREAIKHCSGRRD